MPTVTVIVPNYNHDKYLKKRLDSIFSQTYSDYEVIILDDCSTDNSRDIIFTYKDEPRISLIHINDTNSGSPFNQWINGIKAAKGKYIWIAESDDYASPIFLERTVSELENNPKANVCFSGSHVVDSENNSLDYLWSHKFDLWIEDGKAYTHQTSIFIKEKMIHTNTVYNASMVLFKREGCLDNIDMKFSKMRYCGDWLFWLEQLRKGEQVVEIHSKLNFFRKHSHNTTASGEENFNNLSEVAYIKNFIYSNILSNRIDILVDKGGLYRSVKKCPITHETDRSVLYDTLRQYKVKYWHYIVGRGLRMYKRHIASHFTTKRKK